MKKFLLALILLSTSSIAFDDKTFVNKRACYDFCNSEYHRLMKEHGFDMIICQEDVGTYIAQIQYKVGQCIKRCKELYK